MLRDILKRMGLGLLAGIAMANFISSVLGWPDPFSPTLMARTGTLSGALLLQSLVAGAAGAVCFGGTILYELERLPLLASMLIHYVLCMTAYLSAGLYLGWFGGGGELLIMILVMTAAFLLIFFIMLARYRAEVKRLNEIQRKRKNDHDQKGGI